MRLALLSDIHANVQALDACLAHAQSQGVTHWAVLGDLVGYGANPSEVVARVQALAERGAVVLKGNHEAMAIAPPSADKRIGALTADWTHRQLSPEQRAWLASLPLQHHSDPLLLVHASADAPERWRYVDDERMAGLSLDAASAFPDVRYVFGGHVHHQTLYYKGSGQQLMRFNPTPGVAIPVPAHRRWIATIGSVGQPRDGDTRAGYAVMDLSTRKLTFCRVAYNQTAAAQAVRAAGLPESLAARLESGQ
jgi:predicted phosphodiesterase